MILANAVTFLIQCVGITVFIQRMPLSYYAIGAMIQLILVLAVRFSYRFVLLLRASRIKNDESQLNILSQNADEIFGTESIEVSGT